MPRIAAPGCPHHVTARGNRREPIFFEDGDQDIYCDILAEQTRMADVEVWAYCLMPNHVHLILFPRDEKGLSRAIGAAHKRWANFINGRSRWRGHLFDNRFASVAMDEGHLISAVRYVALNPVRARLVARAQDWKWSSVRAHLEGKDDGLVTTGPVLDRVKDFAALIADRANEAGFAALRAAEQTGRPLGTKDFIEGLERILGRRNARRAPGRKPKKSPEEQQSLFRADG
jgi:putative transposase